MSEQMKNIQLHITWFFDNGSEDHVLLSLLKKMVLLSMFIARQTNVIQHSIRLNWKECDVVPAVEPG